MKRRRRFKERAPPPVDMARIIVERDIVKNRLGYFKRFANAVVIKPQPGLGTFGITDRLIMHIDFAVANAWPMKKQLYSLGNSCMNHALQEMDILLSRGILHPLF